MRMEAFQDKATVKLSPFCKIVRFLSSCYLIPLDVDYKSSKISFSIFSCKTFINALLLSLPFVAVSVYVLLHLDYYGQVVVAMGETYSIIDLGAMFVVPGTNITPMMTIFSACMLSQVFAQVPELSMDTSMKFPKYKSLIFSFVPLMICRIANIIYLTTDNIGTEVYILFK